MSETMKIVYVGGLPDGSCDYQGVTRNFVKGIPVEWPLALAKELIGRVDWELVDEKKSTKGGR